MFDLIRKANLLSEEGSETIELIIHSVNGAISNFLAEIQLEEEKENSNADSS